MPQQRLAYNFFLSNHQHAELRRLTEAGLPPSAVARLAIRKRHGNDLPAGAEEAYPIRINIYLPPDDAATLSDLAAVNNISRADALRRLIAAYLSTNRDAINALF